MDKFRYGSYCGLYCGACEIMKACRKELTTGVKARWEDLPEQFRDNIGKADLVCQGCTTDTVFQGCRGCAIRSCAREKKVESCILCPEYPCSLVSQRKTHLDRIGKNLPHTRVIFRNLDTVREKGMEEWLKERERDWKCPQCGAGFSWYQETCDQCGRELGSLREHNKY
jgi:hypothetical protein